MTERAEGPVRDRVPPERIETGGLDRRVRERDEAGDRDRSGEDDPVERASETDRDGAIEHEHVRDEREPQVFLAVAEDRDIGILGGERGHDVRGGEQQDERMNARRRKDRAPIAEHRETDERQEKPGESTAQHGLDQRKGVDAERVEREDDDGDLQRHHPDQRLAQPRPLELLARRRGGPEAGLSHRSCRPQVSSPGVNSGFQALGMHR